ncbi:hypothetical protein ACFQ1I_42140 [Kitasatospora arboriphila]
MAAALPLAAPAAAADPAATGRTTVTVNASAGLGTVGSTALGANTAVWDSYMNDPQVVSLYKAAGIGALRYPGGSYSDIYHWVDNTAPGGYVAPGTDFDAFMGTVKASGAQPVLIANYGSGTAQEAADWVRYANVTKNYGAKYWEIGNEIYGNGVYGSGWENDVHADKTPDQYAREVKAYAAAMKAVDPTVKIGAVLTMPGNWPDGIVAAATPATGTTPCSPPSPTTSTSSASTGTPTPAPATSRWPPCSNSPASSARCAPCWTSTRVPTPRASASR